MKVFSPFTLCLMPVFSEDSMIFLDTETTDYTPGQIAQLSYILADESESVRAKNFFFTVESMSRGAEQVHGFSKKMLQELSEGRTFADQLDRFRDDFTDRTLVAHNAPFDLSFLAAEFGRLGLYYAPKTFCTMRKCTQVCRIPHPKRGGFKWPTLAEALRALEISPDEVNALASNLFGGEQNAFHDARFDSTAVWLIYRKLMG
jgi:DNA polymerase III subunit epsilon